MNVVSLLRACNLNLSAIQSGCFVQILQMAAVGDNRLVPLDRIEETVCGSLCALRVD